MIGQDWIVIFIMTVRWRGGESKKRMGGAVNMDMKGMIQLVIQMIEIDNNN